MVPWQAAASLFNRLRRLRAAETEELNDDARRGLPGSFVRLPLGTVHYELAGPPQGNTVVLVPGFCVPYYLWDSTFEALAAAGFRVLRYDLYGRGFSDRPRARYNADLFDQQLEDLLNALGLRAPLSLIGASLGGGLVATFAARHAERVRSLVLIDPLSPQGRSPLFRARAPLLGELYMALFYAPVLAEGQLADFYDRARFLDWPSKLQVSMQYKGFRRALLSTIRHYRERDSRSDYARVGQLRLPVALFWGEEDKTVGTEEIARFQRLVPQAEIHRIRRAGHLPQVECPEQVNPLLLQFLSTQG